MNSDPVNDSVKDDLNDIDLAIIRTISKNEGLNSKAIYQLLQNQGLDITQDIIKNSLKRKLTKYCEFRGTFKTGGYYLIK